MSNILFFITKRLYAMRKITALTLLLCCLIVCSCNGQRREGASTEVVLETTLGDIRIALFDDTPGHRDNMVQNIRDGKYDGVTFHRVIRNFMIQTGDPDTRPGCVADTAKPAERIPAEIVYPKYFHKRSFVGAARDGDDENPERQSDKYQFYIVTGKTCSDADLDGHETAREERDAQLLYDKLCLQHKDELNAIRAERNPRKLSDRLEKLLDQARMQVNENPPLTFTREQRASYRSQGGAPWLDGEYTVFGEVVEGMAVVEKIQRLKTNAQDVPLHEVRIKRAYVVE